MEITGKTLGGKCLRFDIVIDRRHFTRFEKLDRREDVKHTNSLTREENGVSGHFRPEKKCILTPCSIEIN